MVEYTDEGVYCVTFHECPYLPETDQWEGQRCQILCCEGYNRTGDEVKFIDTDTGHDEIIVNYDNVIGIVLTNRPTGECE